MGSASAILFTLRPLRGTFASLMEHREVMYDRIQILGSPPKFRKNGGARLARPGHKPL